MATTMEERSTTMASPAAPPCHNGNRQLLVPIPDTYNLCLSFTRNGLKKRVPWLFVLYLTDAPKGTRVRAKDLNDSNDIHSRPLNANDPTPPTGNHTYRFLAREDAYVNNLSCHGRVLLKVGMSKEERDQALKTIENTELSDIGEFRDCQQWVIECLAAIGFDGDFLRLWEGLKAKNVFEIEEAVNGWKGTPGLVFERGNAYMRENESRAELARTQLGDDEMLNP